MTYGTDRTEALSTMAKALDSYVIRGEKSWRNKFTVETGGHIPALDLGIAWYKKRQVDRFYGLLLAKV